MAREFHRALVGTPGRTDSWAQIPAKTPSPEIAVRRRSIPRKKQRRRPRSAPMSQRASAESDSRRKSESWRRGHAEAAGIGINYTGKFVSLIVRTWCAATKFPALQKPAIGVYASPE